MVAKIMMIVDGEEYEYGTFHFNSDSERNRINELAMKIREERDCPTYVDVVC